MLTQNSKEGKNAWKARKQALEDVENSLEKCGGLVSTKGGCFRSLADLCRGLRERLNDSQSNLKPLAAKVIGLLLGAVDGVSQAKLGKIVFSHLISNAMNDNKKLMREASIDALKRGTEKLPIEGNGVNPLSMETFLASLVSELKDSDFKVSFQIKSSIDVLR